jgi:two-component system cell cycle sensor histidine kinase/response regulator CckA
VITDIVMPDGMTGFELAQRLSGKKKNLKIIYTSGYSPDLVKLAQPLVEGSNFLAKPYSLSDLSTIVRQNLDSINSES